MTHEPAAIPATLYAATCPSWCDGGHPAFLTPDACADPAFSDYVLHRRALAVGERFVVSYGIAETIDPEDPEGPCFVSVIEPGATHPGALLHGTPDQLRQWAGTLLAAADLADQITAQGDGDQTRTGARP
ncbi:hypothetical protein TESS_TESS_00855 [Tessaracoccus sp. O5.2]|uniref:hypothetical protein n=1 Tax=Tessaracoccus sp. O5.2 TaxID=3157622 RepID=UPI0035E682CE